jgi:ubiquinone/menaquinone biosynthesis methyltransferase
MAITPPLLADRLLELTYRAEQSHFWFRGFRQYVRPALQRATAGVNGARILDCGCGTGSNLRLLSGYGRAVGFDLTATGVRFARAHGHRVAQASIAAIPFPTATFDLVTSFDVFQCLPDEVEAAAIAEMARVLKPGGRLLVLEFSQIWKPLQKPYDLYSFHVLPWLGRRVAGDSESYRYLAESIRMHPDQAALAGMLERAGLENVEYFNLAAGAVAVHRGYKLG